MGDEALSVKGVGSVKRIQSIEEATFKLNTMARSEPEKDKPHKKTENSEFDNLFESELDKLGKLEHYLSHSKGF